MKEVYESTHLVVGYLVSNELAAIDRVSLELINEVKPGVFEDMLLLLPLCYLR